MSLSETSFKCIWQHDSLILIYWSDSLQLCSCSGIIESLWSLVHVLQVAWSSVFSIFEETALECLGKLLFIDTLDQQLFRGRARDGQLFSYLLHKRIAECGYLSADFSKNRLYLCIRITEGLKMSRCLLSNKHWDYFHNSEILYSLQPGLCHTVTSHCCVSALILSTY